MSFWDELKKVMQTKPENFGVVLSNDTAKMNGNLPMDGMNPDPYQLPDLEQRIDMFKMPAEPQAEEPIQSAMAEPPTPILDIPFAVSNAPAPAAEEKMPDFFSGVSGDDGGRQDLEDQLQRRRRMSIIPEAIATMGDGMMAGASVYGVNGKQDAAQTVRERVDSGIKEDRQLFDEKQLNDPNSSASKLYQQTAALLTNKKPDELASYSAAQIKGVLPHIDNYLKRTQESKEKNQSLQTERDRRFQERQDKLKMDLVTKFNADPGVRKIEQSIDAANTIRELANSGNPIAANAIPTYMARASGEVGNLSEADKAPFGGSRAILERLQAAFSQASTGQMTEDNRRFVNGLTDLMEKRAQENKGRRAELWDTQYSQVMRDIPKGSIKGWLSPVMPEAPQAKQPQGGVPSVGQKFNGGNVLKVTRIK